MKLKVSIGVWNVEADKMTQKRKQYISKRLAAAGANILCITEGYKEILPQDGYCISSAPHYYNKTDKPLRYQVLLWSRQPWEAINNLKPDTIEERLFVAGKTITPIGEVTVIGVCIPYKFRRKKELWDVHLEYLEGLRQIFSSGTDLKRTIVVGDYNQRIPPKYVPKKVSEALVSALFSHFRIATDGIVPGLDYQLIDHLAYTPDFTVSLLQGWPKKTTDGIVLSDHDGVLVELENSYSD